MVAALRAAVAAAVIMAAHLDFSPEEAVALRTRRLLGSLIKMVKTQAMAMPFCQRSTIPLQVRANLQHFSHPADQP